MKKNDKNKNETLNKLKESIKGLTELGLLVERELSELKEEVGSGLVMTGEKDRGLQGVSGRNLYGRINKAEEQLFTEIMNIRRSVESLETGLSGSGDGDGDSGRYMQALRKVIHTFRSYSSEVSDLFERVLDTVISVTDAHRGILALVHEDGSIDFKVSRNMKREELTSPQEHVGRSIILETVEAKKPLLLEDALTSEYSKRMYSIQAKRLRSVICVPFEIESEGKLTGIIYIDHPEKRMNFSEYDLELVEAVGEAATVALQNVELLKDLKEKNRRLIRQISGRKSFEEIAGNSAPMKKLFKQLKIAGQSEVTVLLTGETGSGKELAARAIHYESKRKNKPFVVVDCGTVHPESWGVTLFGCEDRRFTGVKKQTGKFQLAHGGTLFIDEVSSLPLEHQSQFLRVLQERKVWPEGASSLIPVDVRIIAATNRPLHEEVKRGVFREDLYYRLASFPVLIPPLRDRLDDIPDLLENFLQNSTVMADMGADYTPPVFTENAVERLQMHDWPGNVRELQSCIRNTLLMNQDKTEIKADDLIFIPTPSSVRPASNIDRQNLPVSLDVREKMEIDALNEYGFSFKAAAAELKNSGNLPTITGRTLNYHFIGLLARFLMNLPPENTRENLLNIFAGDKIGNREKVERLIMKKIEELSEKKDDKSRKGLLRRVPNKYRSDLLRVFQHLDSNRGLL